MIDERMEFKWAMEIWTVRRPCRETHQLLLEQDLIILLLVCDGFCAGEVRDLFDT